MAAHPHLMRRGTVYYWRRRFLRFSTGNIDLQVSLRTTERLPAVKLARKLSAESDRLMDAVAMNRISAQEAVRYLKSVAAREVDRLAKLQTVSAMSYGSGAAEEDERHDWAYRTAFRLLAQHGVNVALTGSVKEALICEGRSERDLETLDYVLDFQRRILLSEPDARKRAAEFESVAGRAAEGAYERQQLLQLTIEARARVSDCLKTPPARTMAEQILSDEALTSAVYPGAVAKSPVPSPQPAAAGHTAVVSAKPAETPAAANDPGIDPAIDAVIERLIELKRHDDLGLEEKTAAQYRGFATLLQRVTGKTDIRTLVQSDAAHFNSVLLKLPKTFGKSPKDKLDPIPLILERAKALPPETVGLSVATRNRYFDHFGALVTAARNEGFDLDPRLVPGKFRRKETTRARDKKRSFTTEELQRLFLHPFWAPDDPSVRPRLTYTQRRKTGLFWVPIISAYTGLRREEIAGFSPENFHKVGNIWYLDIVGTDLRRIKTASSQRRIPLHPDLVALGLPQFMEAAKKKGQALAFPDLREPASNILGRKVGRHMEAVIKEIWGNAGQGLSLHSMRHYVQNILDNDPMVGDKLARDIMGHEGHDVHSRSYGTASPLERLQAGIERLPSVFPVERDGKRRAA
ncbi:DUF6538 domain-containing protein [Szabonella alba]|uniref:DUF6538 domain-containing protein n=1 Tax=Szabonella alba TaxID=2804194 RepID=A0A8K0Y0G2_9RHOB|nr:DUF6538 domain-containing protein [Szabonella alba]MBL4917088.1 hypothetical protein [Szabonella alba]